MASSSDVAKKPSQDEPVLRRIRIMLVGPSGVLPRRAAPKDDGTFEELFIAKSPENTRVSAICEMLREAAGDPVYSRDTARLMEQCVEHNHPDAWQAFLNDVTTNNVDTTALGAFFDTPTKLTAMVKCIARTERSAEPATHAAYVVMGIQHVAFALSPGSKEHLGRALCQQFEPIIATLAGTLRYANADVRNGIISILAELFMAKGQPMPPAQTMRNIMSAVLEEGDSYKIDIALGLLWHAPIPAVVESDPAIVDTILHRMKNWPMDRCFHACAVLSHMRPEQMSHTPARAAAIERIVCDMLGKAFAQNNLDTRIATVCGTLAQGISPRRSLAGLLGKALVSMSIAADAT